MRGIRTETPFEAFWAHGTLHHLKREHRIERRWIERTVQLESRLSRKPLKGVVPDEDIPWRRACRKVPSYGSYMKPNTSSEGERATW